MIKNKKLFLILTMLCLSSCLYAMDEVFEITKTAMEGEEYKHSLLMENVVNMKTPGYREVNAATRVRDDKTIETQRLYNLAQGHFIATGRKYDLALEGAGFFTVVGENGLLYTRDGRFLVDENKALRTYSGGFQVMGETGPIYIDESYSTVTITGTGKIMEDDNVIDRFLITDFEDDSAIKSVNGSYFICVNDNKIIDAVQDYGVKTGYVEGANVNMSKQMVSIPNIQRMYDANSKVMQVRIKTMTAGMEMGKVQ